MTSQNSGPRVFVTVGSTHFPELVAAVLSAPVLDALSQAAAKDGTQDAHMTVQFGATPIEDILFSETLRLQGRESGNSGTLPIRLLGGESSEHLRARANPSQVAASFSPAEIRRQLADSDEGRESKRASKQFSFECAASDGTVHVELIDYVPSIGPHLQAADVVISHAGSGTILEALRIDKTCRPKLIVVPNETLMGNHQTELAKALSQSHYVYSARLHTEDKKGGRLPALLLSLLLSDSSTTGANALKDFPAFAPGRFLALVDEELGFS